MLTDGIQKYNTNTAGDFFNMQFRLKTALARINETLYMVYNKGKSSVICKIK